MSEYESLVQGLNEAIEYKKGNLKLRTVHNINSPSAGNGQQPNKGYP